MRTHYRRYQINSVVWSGPSDWTPDRCHTCREPFMFCDSNRGSYFYDVEDSLGRLVNEDVAYCSRTCAERRIDSLIETGSYINPCEVNITETQEEATED